MGCTVLLRNMEFVCKREKWIPSWTSCVLPARNENGRGSLECTEGRGLHGAADGAGADWKWGQWRWRLGCMFLFGVPHVPWPDHLDRTPRCSCYGNKCPLGDEPTLTGWNIPLPAGDRVSGLSYPALFLMCSIGCSGFFLFLKYIRLLVLNKSVYGTNDVMV